MQLNLSYLGQLHTPFRKPTQYRLDGSVLYPQLYDVNVATEGVNGTSVIIDSSSPASSKSTLN